MASNSASKAKYYIKKVTRNNLFKEYEQIRDLVSSGRYPFAAIDTEYPGVVCQSPLSFSLKIDKSYADLKANVDRLHLIQVGLTLSDAGGHLPTDDDGRPFFWEFTLRDFDVRKHLHAKDAISLLRKAEIDFDPRSRDEKISSSMLAAVLVTSGLVRIPENDRFQSASGIIPQPPVGVQPVTWITFQGMYDFAYLVKAVRERFKHAMTVPKELPETRGEFLEEVEGIFGGNIYDIRQLMTTCAGLQGGLKRVAHSLGVSRACGKSHQAGSDSLMSSQVFFQMKEMGFLMQHHKGVIFDLM